MPSIGGDLMDCITIRTLELHGTNRLAPRVPRARSNFVARYRRPVSDCRAMYGMQFPDDQHVNGQVAPDWTVPRCMLSAPRPLRGAYLPIIGFAASKLPLRLAAAVKREQAG